MALAMTMLAGPLAGASPALAAVKSPKNFDRRRVIKRAKTWTSKRVPYSQAGYRGGYRRDCSGFLSMAWGLPQNLVTWHVPAVAKRIRKQDLRPGDVLLNNSGGAGRHVVMFEKWANRKRTKYWVLESTGQNGVDSAVRRVVKYPYRIQGAKYKPYRYVGMKGYYRSIPRSMQLPVRDGKWYEKQAASRSAEARKEARRVVKARKAKAAAARKKARQIVRARRAKAAEARKHARAVVRARKAKAAAARKEARRIVRVRKARAAEARKQARAVVRARKAKALKASNRKADKRTSNARAKAKADKNARPKAALKPRVLTLEGARPTPPKPLPYAPAAEPERVIAPPAANPMIVLIRELTRWVSGDAMNK